MQKRVAAYCRVSTKSDDQENSFENQKSFFEREYKNDPDYIFYDIYADRGITGTTLEKRPDFNRMLTDAGLDINDGYRIIAEPKFDLIVTKNTSRFARNVSVDVILKALAKNNVYVHFLDLNKSTENPEDITYIQIFLTFDERESRDKSKKVLFGIEESIKKGVIHSNGNLFGYKYYPKPENRLEIIESEAEIVRMIFDFYVNKGYGLYRIENYLKQNNIMTRNGKNFSGRGLRLIITNQTYTGKGVRKKYTEGLIFNKHNRIETDNAVVFETDRIPAIIDMETFEKAQEILHSRIQHKTLKGKYSGKTEYAGKIICGCCGALYTASNSDYLAEYGRRVRNYTCKTKRTMHYDENGNRVMLCNNPNIYETELDLRLSNAQFLFDACMQYSRSRLFLDSLIVQLMYSMSNQDLEQIKVLQQELDGILLKKSKLLDLYVDNKFSKEELDRKVDPLTEQEGEIREKLSYLTKPIDEIQKDIEDIEATKSKFKEMEDMYSNMLNDSENAVKKTRKEILDEIEYIVITEKKELKIHYKFYDEINRLMLKHRHIMPTEVRSHFDEVMKHMEKKV